MTIVNLKATSLDEGVKNMMNGAKADYVSWTTDKNGNVSDYSKEEIANWDNKTTCSPPGLSSAFKVNSAG